jgi:translation initiation factor IF-2
MTENHQEPPARRPVKVTPASNKTLTLKRSVEQGVVRQSFSHGRTKQVVVEKVKSRRVEGKGPESGAAAPTLAPQHPPQHQQQRRAGGSGRGGGQSGPGGKPSGGVVLRQLTEEERAARAMALTQSKRDVA